MVVGISRRDALKLGAVGILGGLGSILLPKPKPPKRKKKMTIAFDNAANSGDIAGAVNTFNWDHNVLAMGRLPGAVVGVSIFGAAVVNSISCEDATGAIGGGLIRNLINVPGATATNGNYRSEIWYIPGLFEFETTSFVVTFAVNLSATVLACGGSASYSYFGGVGVNGGATGTGTPASKAITPGQSNSYVFSNLVAQSTSGIINAASQNNRWDVPVVAVPSGTGMGSDKLVITPASTTLQFDGITAGHAWAQSSVELLTYQQNPPAIMG